MTTLLLSLRLRRRGPPDRGGAGLTAGVRPRRSLPELPLLASQRVSAGVGSAFPAESTARTAKVCQPGFRSV